jgi:hypothetical protein
VRSAQRHTELLTKYAPSFLTVYAVLSRHTKSQRDKKFWKFLHTGATVVVLSDTWEEPTGGKFLKCPHRVATASLLFHAILSDTSNHETGKNF